MAYIGKTPVIGNFQVCDAITVVDAQAAYTMQVSSVDVFPESANHMLVSLNGILQAPTSSFTVSGSTITFASALETGDVIDFIQILGNVLDLGVPSDATVSTAKIVDANVTTAKIADDAITSAKLGTGDMTFPNGNLVFGTAAKGVYLGVTSATASNLLDDYEEGTWTPTFTSGGNTLTISGGTQTYRYTKIGRQVFIEFNIENSTVSGTAATGDNRITLPFTGTSGAVRNPSSLISFYTSGGLRFTGADVLYGEIGTSSTFIQLQEWVTTSGYRNISVAPTTGSGTYFWFNATYTVD
jgi:hypothetical protein